MIFKKIKFTTSTIIIFIVLLLSANIIIGSLLANSSRSRMRELINGRMLSIAETAGAMLDGDVLYSLSEEDVGTEKQNEVLDILDSFRENMDFEYIYIVRPCNDGTYVFIADADPIEPAEFGEVIVESPALYSAGNGKATVDTIAVGDQWGKFYTAYCPVFTKDGKIGGIVGIDFDANWYEDQLLSSTILIFVSCAVSLLFGGIIVLLITSKLRRKFSQLNDEMISLASDLKSLTDEVSQESAYASSIPSSDLEIVLDEHTNNKSDFGDSIEKLSHKIRMSQQILKKYIEFARMQAYTDSMTGVGNKSAYLEVVHNLNAKLQSEDVQFSIVVFDINSLKRINDDYGHEEGDNLLIYSAKCFKKVFDSKNVFRIGGDEFIAVMENVTENEMSNLLKQLDKEVDDFNNVLKDSTTILVSFSKGFATYNKSKHHKFREVFKEADENLYIDKENYYKDKPQRRLY